MEARYETHRLMDELQRYKILETQAWQEQVLPVTQDVRGKPPAELKTIYQLKATDRPADVTTKLQGRAQKLLDDLLDTMDKTARLHRATPDDLTQLIEDIDSCRRALDVWKHDVTATATEIVVTFSDLQQDHIALRTRYYKLVFLPLTYIYAPTTRSTSE